MTDPSGPVPDQPGIDCAIDAAARALAGDTGVDYRSLPGLGQARWRERAEVTVRAWREDQRQVAESAVPEHVRTIRDLRAELNLALGENERMCTELDEARAEVAKLEAERNGWLRLTDAALGARNEVALEEAPVSDPVRSGATPVKRCESPSPGNWPCPSCGAAVDEACQQVVPAPVREPGEPERTTNTWLRWSGTAWVPGTPADDWTGTRPCSCGARVLMPGMAAVEVGGVFHCSDGPCRPARYADPPGVPVMDAAPSEPPRPAHWECTCEGPPHGTGPEADCDVHGQPSVAYMQGYRDGDRHARQMQQFDTAAARAEATPERHRLVRRGCLCEPFPHGSGSEEDCPLHGQCESTEGEFRCTKRPDGHGFHDDGRGNSWYVKDQATPTAHTFSRRTMGHTTVRTVCTCGAGHTCRDLVAAGLWEDAHRWRVGAAGAEPSDEQIERAARAAYLARFPETVAIDSSWQDIAHTRTAGMWRDVARAVAAALTEGTGDE